MTSYDEQLKQLRQQMSRRKHLEMTLDDLYAQRRELSARVAKLESAKLSEQADVDRLEGRSLASFFYNVIGKMDERLDQERQEAYAAAVKYDAAARELAFVEEDIARNEAELKGVENCEARYEEVLAAKLAALKSAGGTNREEILAIESRITYLEHQMDEVDEAMAAGRQAREIARDVMSSLNSAEGWGTWDLLGGGLIADMAKHNHLDSAQYKVEQLQVALRRFKTELTDVSSVRFDAQVSVDGFLRFADYFFDNLFTDWAVRDRIHQSQAQVQNTLGQLDRVLSKLQSTMDAHQKEWKNLHDELDELVLNTQI